MAEYIIEIPTGKIHGELIRCMECKHNTSTIHNPVCELDAYRSGGSDWFCADGERKEGEDE